MTGHIDGLQCGAVLSKATPSARDIAFFLQMQKEDVLPDGPEANPQFALFTAIRRHRLPKTRLLRAPLI